ncbi:hypothetical protein EDD85DRAFT_1026875 [Armillaria nabsnona]|nr:hypothetical protein EDD85DRAFT_1026875 [Armillaria nabsnona]
MGRVTPTSGGHVNLASFAMALPDFELALAITNLVGSALSAMGSGFIIFCYIFLPMKKHYRHPLIMNLAIADFVNGVNNGISRAVVLATGPLAQSPACTANGFIDQLSVQATDTSILAIASDIFARHCYP